MRGGGYLHLVERYCHCTSSSYAVSGLGSPSSLAIGPSRCPLSGNWLALASRGVLPHYLGKRGFRPRQAGLSAFCAIHFHHWEAPLQRRSAQKRYTTRISRAVPSRFPVWLHQSQPLEPG